MRSGSAHDEFAPAAVGIRSAVIRDSHELVSLMENLLCTRRQAHACAISASGLCTSRSGVSWPSSRRRELDYVYLPGSTSGSRARMNPCMSRLDYPRASRGANNSIENCCHYMCMSYRGRSTLSLSLSDLLPLSLFLSYTQTQTHTCTHAYTHPQTHTRTRARHCGSASSHIEENASRLLGLITKIQ